MDLADALSNAVDQGRGRWFDLLNPWTGEPTEMRVLVAGPDSDVQRRARVAMMDDLSTVADAEGKVSFEKREAARIACLARCVLDWQMIEDGEPLLLSNRSVTRVLRAVPWIEEQVDAFAGNRAAFAPEAAR